eukprot:jgi/Orpsp1_1/1187294/evm.model.d7180000056675.1
MSNLTLFAAGFSFDKINLVPTKAPSAPTIAAALANLSSIIPPAASTGILTAFEINAVIVVVPVAFVGIHPPSSHPVATIISAPAFSASIAPLTVGFCSLTMRVKPSFFHCLNSSVAIVPADTRIFTFSSLQRSTVALLNP